MSYKGSTDQPARVDLFGISNYISGLCSFITDCDTPMTIAIQGDWGSGKTSIMEMVKDNIDKSTVHCVWFNTWQFSQFNTADNLSLSLIDAIIAGLEINDSEIVNNFQSGISRIGDIMANVGKRALYMASDITLGSTTTGDLKNLIEKDSDFKSHESITETISAFKERFQECIDKAVIKHGVNRVLVFIDDLDRLQPLRAVELLEVLKIFLDCEKCVFVLALDYNVVVSGIKRKYGEDFKADKGRSFFDKIIQVPFKMPVAQYDISNFVKKTFEDVASIKVGDNDIKNYVSLINHSIGSNPRSMKRLFNSYLLLLKVIDKDVLDKENSKKALFSILCMQQKFENLYNYIVLNRDNRDEINSEFFNKIACSDDPGIILKDIGIDAEDGEPEEIKAFVIYFNKILSMTGEEIINEDNVDSLRVLLKSSSVTATESTSTGVRIRPTFIYKDDTYMAQGANRMNLGNLALRLIKDYAKETDKSADELIILINTRITCYTTVLKKAGLGQVIERSNPLLGKKEFKELYFNSKDEIVLVDGKEIFVSKGWGAPELTSLIGLLEYKKYVDSNIW